MVSYLLGTPVAGAEVKIQPHAFVTDEAGRFGARIQPSAALAFATIEIRAAGYCRTQVPFPANELAEGEPIRLRLPECAFIDGRVADAAGNAVIGAELRTRTNRALLKSRRQQGEELDQRHGLDLPVGSRLGNEPGWWRCKSDQEGRFRLGGLAPGNPALLLEVKASGYEPEIIELPSTTRPGGISWLDVVLTELPASETSRLSGLVTVNGEATAAYLRWRGETRSGTCSVESDGRYEIPDIERGKVELTVGLDTFAWAAPLCEGAVVQLTIDGESAVHDFDLWPRVGTISGRVVYEDGRPAPGFEVDVECDEVEYGVSGSNLPDGSYSFEVPDGGRPFSVIVYCLGEAHSHPEVLPGSENVDFVLPTLGKILLRIRDAKTNETVPYFRVGWRPAGEPDFRPTDLHSWDPSNPDGRLETRVPVGSIDLVVHAQPLGYRSRLLSGIQVKPYGKGTPVDVDLEPGIDAHFELAPEQEPIPADHFLYLLEPEAWERGALRGGEGAVLGDPGRPVPRFVHCLCAALVRRRSHGDHPGIGPRRVLAVRRPGRCRDLSGTDRSASRRAHTDHRALALEVIYRRRINRPSDQIVSRSVRAICHPRSSLRAIVAWTRTRQVTDHSSPSIRSKRSTSTASARSSSSGSSSMKSSSSKSTR